jgi:hypothetical protein
MLKILSIQPVSLYQNGGAARVLRRFYQGKESYVYSLGIITYPTPVILGNLKEQLITAFPLQRKWMRWHLRTLMTWLRHTVFRYNTIRKARRAAAAIQYDVIHLISHGPYCTAFNTKKNLENKKLWVSFHDHYSTTFSSFSDTKKLWDTSDRRLVISQELNIWKQRV